MPRYLPGGRARRITKIRVDEISEVDRPANGIPFLFYKREDKPADPAPALTLPDLAKWAQRAPVNKNAAPAEYDAGAVAGLFASVLKGALPDASAPGDGTRIDIDGQTPGLTAADYARDRDRIDAQGVAYTNSEKFYPSFHVPVAEVVADPVPV